MGCFEVFLCCFAVFCSVFCFFEVLILFDVLFVCLFGVRLGHFVGRKLVWSVIQCYVALL